MSNDLILTDAEGTPAGYGDTVQYLLDKLGEGQLGPELVTNGTFEDAAGWVLSTAWSVSGGALSSSAPGGATGNASLASAVPTKVGVLIEVTFTISSQVNQNHYFDFGGIVGYKALPAGTGTFTIIYRVAGTDGTLYLRKGDAAASISIDNISVRELKGTHAHQTSASLKPVRGRVPVGGIRNTAPENILAAYTTSEIAVVDAGQQSPGGFPAYRLVPSANAAAHFATGTLIKTLGKAVARLQVYVESGIDAITLYPGGAAVFAHFKLSTLVTSRESGVINNTITNLGGGWYELEAEWVDSANYSLFRIYASSGSIGASADAGDGVSGILVAGPQMAVSFVELDQPYQRVTSDLDVYEEGQQHIEYLRLDHTDDKLLQTFPNGLNGDLVVCGTEGSWVDRGVSVAAGGDLEIGPVNLPQTPGVLPALGDIIGWVPVNKSLTEEEWRRVVDYYKGRGAKGQLVPSGVALVTNGTFDSDLSGWSSVNNEWVWNDGAAVITAAQSSTAYLTQSAIVEKGKTYQLTISILSTDAPIEIRFGSSAPAQSVIQFAVPGEYKAILSWLGDGSTLYIRNVDAGGSATIDNVSIQELIPEEELA